MDTAPEHIPRFKAPEWWVRISNFFLVRIILALLTIGIPLTGLSILLRQIGAFVPGWDHLAFKFFRLILVIIVMHGTYVIYVRVFEKRKVTEFSRSRVWREIGLGLGVGAAIIVVAHSILALTGNYIVVGVNSVTTLFFFLYIALMAGYTEELLMRGIFFRLIEQGLGSWIALIVSALIFGFMHGGNPNATLLSSVFISLEAGILLAGVYMYTRRLWLPIAVHFAWNFTLGGILGTPVSGISQPGLLQGRLEGNPLLTGGSFGIEASLVTAIIATSTGVLFILLAIRRGHFVPAPWHRPRAFGHEAAAMDLEIPETTEDLLSTEPPEESNE